jgi:hypothetical protein
MDNSEDIIRKLNEISQKIDSLERRLDSLQEWSRKDTSLSSDTTVRTGLVYGGSFITTGNR